MSSQTENKMQEFYKWFLEHKNEPSDLEQKTNFTYDVVTNLAYLLTYVIQDIQKLEDANKPKLYVPRGIQLNEPVRRN